MKTNIDEKISQLEAEIEKLNKEKLVYEALIPEERLAELLHEKICKYNHMDGCSWYYSSWIDPNYERLGWLNKSKDFLKIVDFETATKILDIL